MGFGTRYATALVLTIAIELLVAACLRPRALRRLATDVPLVNVLTHPLLALALRHTRLPLPALEGVVVVVEVLLYRRVTGLSRRWAWTVSLAANMASWLVGTLLVRGA